MPVEATTDGEEWNDFLESTDGPVFNRYEWATACELYGHSVKTLVVREEGDIVAGLPLVHIRSRLFGDQLVSMPFSEYGSLVRSSNAPSGTTRRLLNEVRRLADRLGVDFVSLRGRTLESSDGFDVEHRFVSFELPLEGSQEDLWMALDSSRRGHIRTAKENDIEVKEANSVADLRRYYRLYLKNMKRHGSPPHSFGFFRHLWNTLGRSGHMKMHLALADDRLVNGCIRFSCGANVYNWSDISDYEYRDLDGGSLLVWETIKRGCESDESTLHFGRTREGSGVYMFKKSFGGSKTWLDDHHYFPDGTTTLPDVDDARYDTAKRVWKRLPVSLVRTIGPHIRGEISL